MTRRHRGSGARGAFHRRAAAPALLASLALGGCYTHRPLVLDAIPAGTRVEVVLTDRGGVDLAETVGGTAERLSGRVQTLGPERMVVALNRVQMRRGQSITWSGEPVGVPRSAVASVRERRLSWWRTTLMGAAVTAGFLAVIDRLGANIGWLSGAFGGDGGGGGPGTSQ